MHSGTVLLDSTAHFQIGCQNVRLIRSCGSDSKKRLRTTAVVAPRRMTSYGTAVATYMVLRSRFLSCFHITELNEHSDSQSESGQLNPKVPYVVGTRRANTSVLYIRISYRYTGIVPVHSMAFLERLRPGAASAYHGSATSTTVDDRQPLQSGQSCAM